MYQHHIIIPTTLEKEFAEQLNAKRITKYRQCLTWHVAHTEEAYLLCLEQLGYLILADKEQSLEEAIVSEISCLEPEGFVASIDPDPDNITWGVLPSYPKQIRKRINKGVSTLRKCPDLVVAEDEIEKLNLEPITIMGRTYPPVQGLTGLIHELQACYEHYFQNTGALKMLWHSFTGKTPWTDADYGMGKE